MLRNTLRSFWERPHRRYALYSFLFSLFGILLVFFMARVPPFGERSLIGMDAWSQYFPMLMEGKDGLSQWSFSGALGFNRLAQSAYYTMSPLWWILYLFPRGGMYIVLHIVIALRFALAGLTFYLFISHRYGDRRGGIVFSLAYSLSAYTLAFINQFMWMDAVWLLPLVALGLEHLYNRKKPLLYLFSLSLTLYSCFYIGYMVCLFSVLYFLILFFRWRLSLRERAVRCAYFAVFSLLSGGLAAAVLLPTYRCLQATIASGLSFGDKIELYHSFSDVISQFLPFTKISLEYQAPNLYCGTLCLALFALGLLLPGRTWRERIITVLLAVFIYFSCTLNLFDFVWHGMHYPNQLPGRQSFIFVFFIVSEAYAAFMLLCKPGGAKRRIKRLASAAITVLLSIELLANGIYTVAAQTWTCTLSSYSYWDEPMAYVEKTYSDGPWRSEKLSSFHFNSGQLYRYNGISYYSSTMSEQAYRFFGGIGMGVYAQNVSTIYKPSNILNMLFGVRYLHAYNGDKPEEGLYVDHVETVDTVGIYENRYCLPIAFVASTDALELSCDVFKGSYLQNEMLRTLLGDHAGSYYWNETALANAYERLSAGGMKLTRFSDSCIEGTLSCGEDALLFTSIPADEGWRVYVDGERIEYETVFDYLIGVRLSSGEHTVKMTYTAPGFYTGLAISLASLGAVCAFVIWEHRKRSLMPPVEGKK